MPFLAAVVAAVASAVTAVSAAITVGVASAAFAVGISATTALAIGGFASTLLLTTALTFGLQEVSHLLSPQHSAIGGNAVAFKADPNAGYPLVIGRTGVGGNIVFADTSDDGHNTWLHYFTVLSHGPVDAIEGFTANNVPVSFNNDGTVRALGYNWRGLYNAGTQYNINDGVSFSGSIYICVQKALGYDPSNTDYWSGAGGYAGPRWTSNMWQVQRLGLQPDTPLPAIAGAGNVPEWTGANGLSGLACTRWALKNDPAAFPSGTPKPLWILRGAKVYDPRQDGTYPGGSGPQRWNDATTYAWSENPYLHGLTWCIGHFNNGVRVLGLGAPIGAIDVAAFVNGANVADANRWRVGGQVFSTDSKWDVLQQMCAAGGGLPIRRAAQISCIVDTPRVSIATLTGADFTGPVAVQAVASRRNRPNSVKYTYRSETHQWAAVQAVEVTVPAYVAADGQKRVRGVQMPLVQDVGQGAQLARYIIEDAREFGPVTGPVKPQWLGLNAGDCVTVNEPEYGLNNQPLLILDRKIDVRTGGLTLTCRSETGGKHAFALGQTGTPPPAPSLTGIDLVAIAPRSPPWMAVGTSVVAGGNAVPAIVVTGVMENLNATNLVIRTRQSAGPGPWEHYDSPPAPAATRVAITGLANGETRDIGLSYLVRGIQGDELIIAGVTAGAYAGSGATSSTTPSPLPTWSGLTASGAGTQTAATSPAAFTGITAPIVVTLTFTGSGVFAYSKNGGAWTAFASGATVSMSAGDTLAFQTSSNVTASGNLTVYDTTSSTSLATVAYSLTVTGATGTPSATSWADIDETSYASQPVTGDTGAVTLTGFSAPITLSVSWTASSGYAGFVYSKNGGAHVGLTSGATFTVNPGDAVDFIASMSTSAGHARNDHGVVTVGNVTAGGTLQTFRYSLQINTGAWP